MYSCGIYRILSKVNNKFYIGSSIQIERRFNKHKSLLTRNLHHSPYLQRTWNKYGEENIIFEILELTNKEELLTKEQTYLDNLNPEYNILKVAGSHKGAKRSEESIKRMSLANLGKKLTKEHKEKVSLNSAFSKRVYMIDKDNNIMEEFRSVSEASRIRDTDRTGISMACKGILKTSGGYKWRFVND